MNFRAAGFVLGVVTKLISLNRGYAPLARFFVVGLMPLSERVLRGSFSVMMLTRLVDPRPPGVFETVEYASGSVTAIIIAGREWDLVMALSKPGERLLIMVVSISSLGRRTSLIFSPVCHTEVVPAYISSSSFVEISCLRTLFSVTMTMGVRPYSFSCA